MIVYPVANDVIQTLINFSFLNYSLYLLIIDSQDIILLITNELDSISQHSTSHNSVVNVVTPFDASVHQSIVYTIGHIAIIISRPYVGGAFPAKERHRAFWSICCTMCITFCQEMFNTYAHYILNIHWKVYLAIQWVCLDKFVVLTMIFYLWILKFLYIKESKRYTFWTFGLRKGSKNEILFLVT